MANQIALDVPNYRTVTNWENVPFCEITEIDYEKYELSYGDIVIARMADPGHAAFFEDDIEAVFASYLIRFKPRNIRYDRYLQYWLRSRQYWQLVNGAKTGTTRSSLNAKVLGSFKLLLPSPTICKIFADLVQDLRAKIIVNNEQMRTLAETRDALLPKLVSGELRVTGV